MSDNIFQSKSKADLVQIVRVSGIMPVSKAQRMKKQELANYLAEQMNTSQEEKPGLQSKADQTLEKTEQSSTTGSARGRRSRMKSAPPEVSDLPQTEDDDKRPAKPTSKNTGAGEANAVHHRSVMAVTEPMSSGSAQTEDQSEDHTVTREGDQTETRRAGTVSESKHMSVVPAEQEQHKDVTDLGVDRAHERVQQTTQERAQQTSQEGASHTARERAPQARATQERMPRANVAADASADEKNEANVAAVTNANAGANAAAAANANADEDVDAQEASYTERALPSKINRRNAKQRPGQQKKNVSFQSRQNRSDRNIARNNNTAPFTEDDERLEAAEFSARPRQRQGKWSEGAALAEKNLSEQADQFENKTETAPVNLMPSEVSETETTDNRTAEETKAEQPRHTGVLEMMPDGYGFLRSENYIQGPADVYVSAQIIRRFSLRAGDLVTGTCRNKRDQDRYQALNYIEEVNGMAPSKMHNRPHFDRLTPIYPTERYVLETDRKELATRIIDLFSPIGKGQRGMIVSPPKAGKTILLQKIANAISINNPEAKLIVLLIDERPEEVTDMQRRINGEVVYSTFDKTPENHVKITELVLERAKRLVELGQDVVILLDSMTRMARAYNLTITPTGRTLSGGLDPGALHHPKRFFGAARNIENGGSLTIVATSLIETGSRMDEVIFEEFKGTGNMEVVLDRKLSEKRIFPAIDINKSGTRREELLLTPKQLEAVWGVRKAFGQLDTANVTELIINLLLKTKDNDHMIDSLNISLKDQTVIDAMRLPQESSSNGKGQGYNR